ncbi:MAG TPA: anaerobic ribonucleoside-triphosphate reductase [Planctomycetota bacterium]|nr:anaerobic ribonucleoside-triphosphate reductase [Planctomycetota bacterium]
MDIAEFYTKVETHPDIQGLDLEDASDQNDGPAALLLHKPTGNKFRILLSTVEKEDWGTLEAIVTGRRDAQVLDHMTRVVGYYSRVQNWNRSKLGELRDRHAGKYQVGQGTK